jgi:hypothetical protein
LIVDQTIDIKVRLNTAVTALNAAISLSALLGSSHPEIRTHMLAALSDLKCASTLCAKIITPVDTPTDRHQ